MKINFISNTAWYLHNFRKKLIKDLINEGYEVNVIAPYDRYADNLLKLGANYYPIKLTRFKKSVLSDFILIVKLIYFNLKLKPDIIHHFTIKPVIYGSIASWFFPKIKIVNSIPGLGLSFNVIYKNRWVNKLIMFLYRIAFKKKHTIIFQNPDDMNFFIKEGILNINQCHLIKSSGVDLEEFRYDDKNKLEDGFIRYGIASRMLWSKGIKDFVEASKIVYAKNKNTKFHILGSPDTYSPDAIPIEWLKELNNYEHISWEKHSDDIDGFLNTIHIFVLPTYYPEGLPKSLIEAGAKGLPLIATNSSGCREVIQNGYNGYLVNIKDQIELAQKMYQLSLDEVKRKEMGINSRKIIEQEYDVNIINKKTMSLYNSI